ncbi:MAG: LOG family protein [Chromatiales bacterium]|nr:LOG family protein [Chromatiales bacterium]
MPEGSLEVLSRQEVERLRSAGDGGQNEMLRRCALAVLNTGHKTDDTRAVLARYRDFAIDIVQQDRGVKLALSNPPSQAFVDGQMIRGIRELLFAVLRDVVYCSGQLLSGDGVDLSTSEGITNAVFLILRNAGAIRAGTDTDLVVCWGGHAISREEYDYSKQVGYQLGLRKLNVCTGCGGGAMKGPMKGAAIAHAKQRVRDGRYLGLTEPTIIAAESPNPIVNELVILPDMEKRLEAFVRVAHAIVIFPGGAGTAEEILFLLGILSHPDNQELPFPLVLTGPESSRGYLEMIDSFILKALGPGAQRHYRVIVGDPDAVAADVAGACASVRRFRREHSDAYFFNWRLRVESVFQQPFVATHESMEQLALTRDLPRHELAANLRRVFSGIVSGNIRVEGQQAIEARGPFQIRGEAELMGEIDHVLQAFVREQRMSLSGRAYQPCYRVIV